MIDSITSRSTESLFRQFYSELRSIAQRMMLKEKAGNTLSATALVNESYLRIAPRTSEGFVWNSRDHFVATAAEAMRRTLIDRARAKQTQKRSCNRQQHALETVPQRKEEDLEWLLDVSAGLELLSKQDAKIASLVHIHLFGGLPIHEAGRMVGLTRWGSYQAWEFAVAWFAARSAILDTPVTAAGESPFSQRKPVSNY